MGFCLFVFNYDVEEAFISELRNHLQHVDADLLRIVVQTGADDAEAIRCQYPAMQFVGLVLLVPLIFLVRDLLNGGYPVKLEFVSQNHQQCSGSNQDTPYH